MPRSKKISVKKPYVPTQYDRPLPDRFLNGYMTDADYQDWKLLPFIDFRISSGDSSNIFNELNAGEVLYCSAKPGEYPHFFRLIYGDAETGELARTDLMGDTPKGMALLDRIYSEEFYNRPEQESYPAPNAAMRDRWTESPGF